MPPKKGKGKKKSKEELEEERRKAEEDERLAEEERLRIEEADRKQREELEKERQRLLANLFEVEGGRVAGEKDELQAVFGQFSHERDAAAVKMKQAKDWERFLHCTHVPHPMDEIAINAYFTELRLTSDEKVQEALQACLDCEQMASEVMLYCQEADLEGNMESVSSHQRTLSNLHEIINLRLDRVSAHVLGHSDEYANERGEIQLAVQGGSFAWGIWVNVSKNPRLRIVELPQINITVEITKSIALNNICLRVQHRTLDEFYLRCTNDLMAINGVMYADLLALPAAAKKVRGWTIRHVTALSYNVLRIPYPIPPAGSDPLTYRADEEPPPLGFTLSFPSNIVLLTDDISVGWWDAEVSAWSTQGISEVSLDRSSGSLMFKTRHLAPLAVVQSRAALLPYKGWSIRPTGGQNGSTAEVTLELGLPEPLVLEVCDAGTACLKSCAFPQLADLSGVHMTPSDLLLTLSRRGLHLLPAERDAAAAGTTPKKKEVEVFFCQDLALLGGAFLIASSRWNQAAGPEDCLARVNEVLDWEEGGRTELHHLQRIFTKEKEDGERRVLGVMCRGTRGVAFTSALDKQPEYVSMPGYNTCECIMEETANIWGEVHCSLLSLLTGHQGEMKETALALQLQATPEGLELVKNTNPIFTKTLGDLMYCLRLFSFG